MSTGSTRDDGSAAVQHALLIGLTGLAALAAGWLARGVLSSLLPDPAVLFSPR